MSDAKITLVVRKDGRSRARTFDEKTLGGRDYLLLDTCRALLAELDNSEEEEENKQ